MLESTLSVLGAVSKFADDVRAFLTLTKPAASFAAAGYAQQQEQPLWTLGRREASRQDAPPAQPAMAVTFKLPPSLTPAHSFTSTGCWLRP